MEDQNPKNGTKMPSIMHTNEPNMQFLGSKLGVAYRSNCASYLGGEHICRKTKDLNLDCAEKSREMKGRKLKKNKNQEI